MTSKGLSVVVKKQLVKSSKYLWDLTGKEIEIWVVRGNKLLEWRNKIEPSTFIKWCEENDYWGFGGMQNLNRQMNAAEFLEHEENKALMRYLPMDYAVLSWAYGICKEKGPEWLVDKIEANKHLLSKKGKLTQKSMRELNKLFFPKETTLLLKGPMKDVWKTQDFKFLRQQCHPDKHPEEEKEKWEKVWKLIEFAYKGEK